MAQNETLLAQTGTSSGTKLAQENPDQLALRKQEKKRTARLKEILPRGIILGQWPDGRAKPFYVRYTSGGARSCPGFQFECDRNDFAAELLKTVKTKGAEVLEFIPDDVREWSNFKTDTGATMTQVRSLWAQFHTAVRTSSIPTKDAVERYLTLRRGENIKETSNTYRQMRKHLRDCLGVAFGERLLSEITTEDLRILMRDLSNEKGKPYCGQTKHNYRKNWNTFFDRAVSEKWIRENPCALVIPPSWDEIDKYVMPVKELFQLFKANRDQPVAPKLALEVFGLMRASAVGRMSKGDVRPERRGLYMPGRNQKSGTRKYRQGHPAVLWEWLQLATDQTWEMSERTHTSQKSAAFLRANVVNPGNVLRHTGISYLVAATKEIGKVSTLAQHVKITQTEDYEGFADEKDAALFLAISPAAVLLTWEEFLVQQQRTTQ